MGRNRCCPASTWRTTSCFSWTTRRSGAVQCDPKTRLPSSGRPCTLPDQRACGDRCRTRKTSPRRTNVLPGLAWTPWTNASSGSRLPSRPHLPARSRLRITNSISLIYTYFYYRIAVVTVTRMLFAYTVFSVITRLPVCGLPNPTRSLPSYVPGGSTNVWKIRVVRVFCCTIRAALVVSEHYNKP